MPKRKNHTGRNATVKAHANGIKKAKNHKHTSLKGTHISHTLSHICTHITFNTFYIHTFTHTSHIPYTHHTSMHY